MKNDSVITSRGQITLPKRLRDRLGLRNGMRVRFTATRQGVLIQKKTAPTSTCRKAFGILSDDVTTDEYLAAVRGPVK